MPILPTDLAAITFTAYNHGGPPERAGLTYDGKPVPAFEAVGAAVQHKWTAAASAAARVGAELAISRAAAAGVVDVDELRAEVMAALTCPPWEAPAVTS